MRQFREENRKLKTLVANLTLGQTHPAGGALKKNLQPRRGLVHEIREACQLNESCACELVGITRWINCYQSRRDPQDELRIRLRELADTRMRSGDRRLTVMLRREGGKVNTKRVYRIYREENPGVRMAQPKKPGGHLLVPLPSPVRVNQRWSMDFVSDRLADGRWFRILTVVDQCSRECLCVWADRSQTGEIVVAQMQRRYFDHERREVDSTEGLSPAISIEQKTANRRLRSTVGTITEIYDYLRALCSSIGAPHGPKCGIQISRQTTERMLQQVLTLGRGELHRGPVRGDGNRVPWSEAAYSAEKDAAADARRRTTRDCHVRRVQRRAFAVLHGPDYAWTWQYILLVGFGGTVFGAVRYSTASALASAPPSSGMPFARASEP